MNVEKYKEMQSRFNKTKYIWIGDAVKRTIMCLKLTEIDSKKTLL